MQDDQTQTEKTAATPSNNGKRKRAGIILFLLIAVSAIAGLRWWIMGSSRVTTDNAFVESHIHSVASRVSGMVRTVAVRDNQAVRQGDLLDWERTAPRQEHHRCEGKASHGGLYPYRRRETRKSPPFGGLQLCLDRVGRGGDLTSPKPLEQAR